MARRVRIKDPASEQRLFESRVLLALIVVVASMLVLIGRLFWLQVIRYDDYSALSQGNRVKLQPLPPDRGVLFDRTGKILAENAPAFQLELTRERVPDLDATLTRLAQLQLLTVEEMPRVRRLINSRRRYEAVPIQLQLTDEQVGRFAVHRHELRGVELTTRLARTYPYGGTAVHALGYVGVVSEADLKKVDPDKYLGAAVIGKSGLEEFYESELHGDAGFRELVVNAEGRLVGSYGAGDFDLKEKQPLAGNDLFLSIDVELQQVAEKALEGRRGAVVAIDPWTGDVLALASMPTFDPNLFTRGISTKDYRGLLNDPDRPLFNRVLRGTYPPGSTIKPMMALAGLEQDVVETTDTVRCPGYFYLPGSRHRYRDWKREGHGVVNMRDAVATSCDVYFYQLAAKLGIVKVHESMTHLGFGSPTGIDLNGERGALMPSPEWKKKAFKDPRNKVWFPGETVIVGIGQGYWTVTPLQLASATSMLATRGQRFKPRLVTAIRDAKTGEVKRLPPQPMPPIELNDPTRWETIVEAMVAVTSGPRGTATGAARGAAYKIAGKTGTAQVFSLGQNEKYNADEIEERLRDHALFVAFAPAEAPKIAVAILVENGGSGSGVAAPVARKLFDNYLLRDQKPDAGSAAPAPSAAPPTAPPATAPAPAPDRAPTPSGGSPLQAAR